ncbi:hypothetical protein [Tenacibaculum amylolyticum]|uniref:hypothetical protein n=1 Tax=Tenacibaculum amylolyticum TaxID=104269 RepID=UPI003896453E
MKLTQQHINQLYQFTRQHYVEHFDVQTELVDHLANDIEQIWEQNPSISFEQARDISFKKFGVFGFMDVVEKKQKQMNKKYLKIIFGFVKEWFSIPKIILTLSLCYTFYLLLSLPFANYIFTSFYFTLIIIEFIMIFKKRKQLKNKFKKTQKKWMLEEIIQAQGLGNIALLSFYIFHFLTPDSYTDLSLFANIIIAFSSTLLVIVGYITLIVIPKKSEEILETHYPEYKLV